MDELYATNNSSNASGGPNATFGHAGPVQAPQNQITFAPGYTNNDPPWQSPNDQNHARV
jgi:hypothetical protein